ncbi:RHS repeat-associated core domain-containing protein [Algoriphagus boritolerans DSM 17298 = JCM 18970]|uniref:RHS repeat-associated core domain-containing protein n=2 Tax=Algoriphagus TaxID=246875 RepID=A0A1H6ASK7_9BACT|nr:RHS repeat-associated core domain-containing protein [Algoriphagus boritolerans DSM 17298 = JCM 18970]
METFVVNETSEDVWFDNMMLMSISSPIAQETHYDPWGLELTGIGFQYGGIKVNNWKFQGQESIDDLGLNWSSFKWRNHQPDIGRFFNIDPLSDKYVHNSPYAFSENKVTSHVELEGLEASPIHPSYGLNNITETFRRAAVDIGNSIDKTYLSLSTTYSQIISTAKVNLGLMEVKSTTSVDVNNTVSVSSNFADFLTPVQGSNGDLKSKNSSLFNFNTESTIETVTETSSDLSTNMLDIETSSVFSLDLSNGNSKENKDLSIGKAGLSLFNSTENNNNKQSNTTGIRYSLDVDLNRSKFNLTIEAGKKDEK